jgi:DNA-binding cell septation regulator SpoVG
MEWASGAASPKDIGIPELASLTRDEILTAFPIAPYMLGVPMSGGLNESGASRREEKATYWEETIHPRVEAFEEDIQVQMLSRYEEIVGQTLDFEVQEPNLDDAQSLLEKAGAFRAMVAIGFDGEAVIDALKLDNIEWLGLPEMLDPAKQLEMQQAATEARAEAAAQLTVSDSASSPPSIQQGLVDKSVKARTRADVMGREGPGLDTAMRRFLRDQRERVSKRIADTLPDTKAARRKAGDDWWDAEAEDEALSDALREPQKRITRSALQVVADTKGRVVMPRAIEPILEASLQSAGQRIKGINETTRQAIADALTEGTRRGYSIPQIVNGVPDEGYTGVRDAPMKNGQSAFDELRAETIARTETMNAYNDAALRGYDSFGVKEVQAIDGDEDEDCASRDGQVYPIDEALDITDHPNGTLDWVPLSKSYREPDVDEATLRRVLSEMMPVKSEPLGIIQVLPSPVTVDVHVPDQQAPTVNVNVPKQDTPSVTVNVPEQAAPVVNVKAADVIDVRVVDSFAVQDVRVVDSLVKRTKKVQRDQAGRITEITEE